MTDECVDSDPGEFVSEEGLDGLRYLLDLPPPAVVTALPTAWDIAFALEKERLEKERQRLDGETQMMSEEDGRLSYLIELQKEEELLAMVE